MKTGKVIPLFGEGIVGKSAVVTAQRRLNVYLENRRDGDKSKVVVFGTPGLKAKFTLAGCGNPARGMLGTQAALYAVAGNAFYQLYPDTGEKIYTAALQTSIGHCEMATNEDQVLVVDGLQGYLWASNALTMLPSAFPAGARTCTYVSSFFVAESPGTQQFYVSNADDGSTWNALAFASANAYQDLLLAVDNLDGNLVLFSQLHIEFWQNVGTSPVPFAPVLSAISAFGLAAIASRAHVGDSILFLTQNRQGQVQVCRVQGFTVRVVSTPDLDYLLNQLGTVSDAVGLSYGVDAHAFYQLTFPAADRSFLWDASTELWSEVQSGVSAVPARHAAQYSTYCAGVTLLSDATTDQLYTMDPNTYTDNGTTIVRELVTRHTLSNFDRVRPSVLYLDMETGVGLQSGQGSDPQIMLQYSKDNGRTWSGERWASLGKTGQYRKRVIWRRFGRTRDAVWKIRMTDPVKFVITEGAAKLRVRSR